MRAITRSIPGLGKGHRDAPHVDMIEFRQSNHHVFADQPHESGEIETNLTIHGHRLLAHVKKANLHRGKGSLF